MVNSGDSVATADAALDRLSQHHTPRHRHDRDEDRGGDPGGETTSSLPEMVIGPYPSYSMGPMEITLVLLLFVVWLYAAKRFYTVWSNVLNFSAIGSEFVNSRQPKGEAIYSAGTGIGARSFFPYLDSVVVGSSLASSLSF